MILIFGPILTFDHWIHFIDIRRQNAPGTYLICLLSNVVGNRIIEERGWIIHRSGPCDDDDDDDDGADDNKLEIEERSRGKI